MISSQISYDGMSFFALETQPGTQTFGSGSGTDHYYFNKDDHSAFLRSASLAILTLAKHWRWR